MAKRPIIPVEDAEQYSARIAEVCPNSPVADPNLIRAAMATGLHLHSTVTPARFLEIHTEVEGYLNSYESTARARSRARAALYKKTRADDAGIAGVPSSQDVGRIQNEPRIHQTLTSGQDGDH